MKKVLGVLLLTVCFLMAGCGDKTGSNDETKITETPAATATPAPTEEELKMIEKMQNVTATEVVAEMKVGWNLGNTMDSTDGSILKKMSPSAWETAWGNPVTSEALIDKIIDSGFNVVRIPVSWVDHLLPAEDYKIEEKWMARVRELVDYAYKRGAYVIINAHHEGWYDPYYENQEKAERLMKIVWTQIAEEFKGYDEHLIFEGMNEPRKRNTALEWNGGDQEGWDVVNHLNQVFIDTVRATGGTNAYRMLMIPGYAANCTVGIRHLEVPEGDDRLIVSVHAYEPYDFALNTSGRGLWNNDTKVIDTLFTELQERFVSKGIPVIIGETGALYKEAEGNEESRAAWAEYYFAKSKEYGIPCIWWDNGLFTGEGEPFGLIDRETLEWVYPQVVEGIFKGLNK